MNNAFRIPSFVVISFVWLAGWAAFSGRAAEPPRAARSVHLNYTAGEGDLFYNEVTVGQSTPGSYFMACGWNTGYFGFVVIEDGRAVSRGGKAVFLVRLSRRRRLKKIRP